MNGSLVLRAAASDELRRLVSICLVLVFSKTVRQRIVMNSLNADGMPLFLPLLLSLEGLIRFDGG